MSLLRILNNPYIQRKQLLESLEERIVLDAGACADNGDNPDENNQETSSEPGGSTGPAESGLHVPAAGTAAPQQSDPLARIFTESLEEVLVSSDLSRLHLTGDAEAESQEHPDLLVVSSALQDADRLLEAAREGVLTILYDGDREGPDAILSRIEQALGGRTAHSIAFAAHDLGEGKFHLSGGVTVSPGTLASNDQLGEFWQGIGSLVTDGGRIDLLACELASTESGSILISQLEQLTGRNVAASDDPTGNPAYGGDWLLETDHVDLVAEYFDAAALGGFSGLLTSEDKITASDGAMGDSFGWSVSLDDYWAVVGAPQDDDNGLASGAAYIYHFEAGTWVEHQKLTASDGRPSDLFGRWVAIDGEWTVVGGEQDDDMGYNSGSAYMFHLEDGTWVEKQKLTASDGDSMDRFGGSGAIDGEYAIIGAAYDEDKGFGAGAAYVFQLESGSWVERAKLLASDGAMGDSFGRCIDMEGDRAVIGAPYEDANGSNAGAAYVYHLEDGSWVEQEKLLASDGTMFDQFGLSVSISGDYVIAGAPYDHESPGLNPQAGSAYVYQLQGESWIETQRIIPEDSGAGNRFGISVSVAGDHAVVGAYQDNDRGLYSGSVSLFNLEDDTWVEVEDVIPLDGASGDRFGYSVSTDGVRAVMGSYGDDDMGANSGAAYVYGITAPQAGGFTVTADEDTLFPMTWWWYVDPQGDAATSMQIGPLPEHATLFLDTNDDNIIDPGEEIVAYQEIDWADATVNGLLKFTPDVDWNGTTTFHYCVKDATDYGSAALVTVNLNPVNDGPDALPFSVSGQQDSVTIVDGWQFTDAEGDDASKIRITGFETGYGTLFLDSNANDKLDPGEAIVLDQEINWVEATAGGVVKFAPDPGWYGSTWVSYSVSDGVDYGSAAAGTIVVTRINNAPMAGSFTETGLSGTAFVIEGWNFTDGDGDDALLMRVTDLPGHGTLFLDDNANDQVDAGEAIVANQEIDWVDATTGGLVKFAADPGWHGLTTLTYEVSDGIEFGTFAGAGFFVRENNSAPVANSFFLGGWENGLTFVGGFSYTDADGDEAAAIKITALPENGTLFLDLNRNYEADPGEEVVLNQEIAWEDVTDNFYMRFAPDRSWFGITSFSYSVTEGIEYGPSGDVTMTILMWNRPPYARYFIETGVEDTVLVVDGWDYRDYDDDPATMMKVTALPAIGTLFLDANSNDQVDPGEAIEEDQEISWADASENGMIKYLPAKNWSGDAFLYYRVKDDMEYGSYCRGTIRIPNIPNEPVAGPFTESGYEDTLIVLDDWNCTYEPGHEPTGIEITSLPVYDGTIFYDANENNECDYDEEIRTYDIHGCGGYFQPRNNQIDWEDATVNGKVKFIPTEDWFGSTSFTYRVRDGWEYGPTAEAQVDVYWVNDPPEKDAWIPYPGLTLCSIPQDYTWNNGDTVAEVFWSNWYAPFYDPDDLYGPTPPTTEDVVIGIAVVGVDDTNGTWEYSTDGGENWIPFGDVSDSSAVLLSSADPETRVRFVPDPGWSGLVAQGLTIRGWDERVAGFSGEANVNVWEHQGACSAETLPVSIEVRSDGIQKLRQPDMWTELWTDRYSCNFDFGSFGTSVDIGGDFAVVRSNACVYVYQWNGIAWDDPQRIEPSGGASGTDHAHVGQVAIDGDFLIIGSSDSAYIFRWDGASWVQFQTLPPSEASGGSDPSGEGEPGGEDQAPGGNQVAWGFGSSVAIDGDYAVVGAGDRAYIYHWDGIRWGDQQVLQAFDLVNTDWMYWSGCPVALAGDYAIVGFSGDDANGDNSGAACVYRLENGTWIPDGKLTAGDGNAWDRFGSSVSIDAEGHAAVGTLPYYGTHVGHAYMFHREGSSWVEDQKLTWTDGNWWWDQWQFGDSVAIDGDYALVGAPDYWRYGGATYAYRCNDGSWTEEMEFLADPRWWPQQTGASVSLDSEKAIIGASGIGSEFATIGEVYLYGEGSWSINPPDPDDPPGPDPDPQDDPSDTAPSSTPQTRPYEDDQFDLPLTQHPLFTTGPVTLEDSGEPRFELPPIFSEVKKLADDIHEMPDFRPVPAAETGIEVVEPLTGLYGYAEKVKAGHILVFNMDELLCMDLFSDTGVVTSPPKDSDTIAGLPGFGEALGGGKALVFDLDEMRCLDLCTGRDN